MPTAIKPVFGSSHEIPTLIRVDPSRPGNEQANIHTRYHPDIPCVATLELDKPFKVECLDYSGGQVRNDDCADDVVHLDHDSDHHLSGPIFVPGARPGDVLEIDILDVQPFPSQPWGFSVTQHSLGSLDHPGHPTRTTKSIWDFHGVETSSRHIPCVSFHGRPHPGVVATAPSAALLAEWTRREGELAAQKQRDGEEVNLCLPTARSAYVGQEGLSDEVRERIYREGARTSPAREHGGNIDVASLTRGSKLYLPVYVPGAKLSIGDVHFQEGEGEPTTAIEMAGIVTLRVNILSASQSALPSLLRSPMYEPSPSEPLYPRKLFFTGLSVIPPPLHHQQQQHGLSNGHDVGSKGKSRQTDCGGLESYRMACFAAIEYLQRFGYTREQAYMILSCAPVDAKIVATANRPNMTVALGLPLDIFSFDISPRGIPPVPYRLTGPAVPSSESAPSI